MGAWRDSRWRGSSARRLASKDRADGSIDAATAILIKNLRTDWICIKLLALVDEPIRTRLQTSKFFNATEAH